MEVKGGRSVKKTFLIFNIGITKKEHLFIYNSIKCKIILIEQCTINYL